MQTPNINNDPIDSYSSGNNISFIIDESNFVYQISKHINDYYINKVQDMEDIKMVSCETYKTYFLNYDGKVFLMLHNDIKNGNNNVSRNNIPSLTNENIIKLNLSVPIKFISSENSSSYFISSDDILYTLKYVKNTPGLIKFTLSAVCKFDNLNCCKLTRKVVNSISSGCDFSIFSTTDGSFFGLGNNCSGQFGNGTDYLFTHENPININKYLPQNIERIVCGAEHTIFLDYKGKAYGCGSNVFNQLGLDNECSNKISNIYFPLLIFHQENIIKVWCGAYISLALDSKNNLYRLGTNISGSKGFTKNCQQGDVHCNQTILHNVKDLTIGNKHMIIKYTNNRVILIENDRYLDVCYKFDDSARNYKQLWRDNHISCNVKSAASNIL